MMYHPEFPRFFFGTTPKGDTLYLSIAGGEDSGPMIHPAASSFTIYNSMILGYCVTDCKLLGTSDWFGTFRHPIAKPDWKPFTK